MSEQPADQTQSARQPLAAVELVMMIAIFLMLVALVIMVVAAM